LVLRSSKVLGYHQATPEIAGLFVSGQKGLKKHFLVTFSMVQHKYLI